MKTLTEMLATIARQNSSRAAIVEGKTAMDYAELEKRIFSLADQLYHLGIRPGDQVALLLPNGSDFIISYFAIVTAGAVVVPLNEQYQQTEISHLLTETGASLIITSRPFAGLCQDALRAHKRSCRIFFVENRSQSTRPGIPNHFRGEIHPDAPVMSQFSSGSTGRPKRISRSHRNLLLELDSLLKSLQISNEDRFIGVTPFSHVNGLMRSMMASLRAGATLYPVAKFDRQAVADVIEKHRISIFIGVPFMFGVLAKTKFRRPPDFSSLRLCMSASAPMPANLNRQFRQAFGTFVRQLYGSTETGTISANLRFDIENTLESVGTPIDGVQVEIVAEDGGRVPPGTIGEVAVKSPAAIERYDGLDGLNEEVFCDGYFLTGDVGKKDPDGLLYLVGRKKFFINKGGYKINPHEIEELLESHPGVEEAVVVGLPTLYGDEKVKAVVVLKEACTEEEMIEYCRGKIAGFKVPSLVEFAEELPKGPTGKIRRSLLT